jgi:prepilin-type N-terminal cleavage/methylation domain-containing protein
VRRRAEAGFTLLELLVAMAITIFGLMGLMAGHLSLSSASDRATETEEAVTLGQQLVEELRAQRVGDLMKSLTGSSTSTAPQTITDYLPQTGRNGLAYHRDVRITQGPTATLWRIRVEVYWNEDNATGATNQHRLPFEIIRSNLEQL